MDSIPNVLAQRYASPEMRRIWSAHGRIGLERDLWIAVLKAQRDLGVPVPEGCIEAYESVRDQIDLEAIRERERVTRHDVKARIEAFCQLAGFEQIHKGLTSRDLTENVEQLQVFRSLHLVRDKAVAALAGLGRLAVEQRDQVCTARTHNVAAQPTTLGKRFAMWGEELMRALERVQGLVEGYPGRGIKGAVGTQLDLLTLFGGDRERVAALDARVGGYLGLPAQWGAVGQVYPRSLDLEVVSVLNQVASGPASFAVTLRLMSGLETASEGFAPGQVGSSAMPHKMNARSCERIGGFKVILNGHLAMAAELAGGQWNEGDVSCSVVRRVLLPDAFFALDGLLETFLTILAQIEIHPAMIAQENQRYFPFLLSTTFLMEAVRRGADRETAHEAIREHALMAARDLRCGGAGGGALMDRLAADPRLRLGAEVLAEIISRTESLCGQAGAQVDAFAAEVECWVKRFPEAARYQPHEIL